VEKFVLLQDLALVAGRLREDEMPSQAATWNSPAMKFRTYINMIGGVVAAFSIWLPSVAVADWAYTRWGMTPEQVAAASGDAVTVLPPAQRTRNEDDHWELAAEGTYTDGMLSFAVGFTFDTQGSGLKCVMYNAMGDDVEALRIAMGKRYGRPSAESSFDTSQTLTWRRPDNIELIIGQSPMAAVVIDCMGKALTADQISIK